MKKHILLFIEKERNIFYILLISFLLAFLYVFTNRIPEFFLYWKELMDLLFALSVSVIAAIIFYIFQVYIPNIQKSKKIVKIFEDQYKYFKLNTLQTFIWVLWETKTDPENLIELEDFKWYFDDEKWRSLINQIEEDSNDEHFKDLIFQIELLHKKINFLLLSIDLPHDVFSFFHILDENLFRLEHIKKDNDRYQNDYKIFWRTLFELYSWRDPINWYSDIDFVKKNLNKIYQD